jgi:Tol biopolymer transport system component
MTQVFISYSRKDLVFVERLVEDLKKANLDVWYDLSGLEGGARWRKEIQDAIKNSQYVIVVLSPDSVESEWVEREFLFASNLKLKIIPLIYKQCELPMNYLNLNFIDVQGNNYRKNFGEILEAINIRSVSGGQPPAVPGGSSKTGWIAAGIVAVVGLIIIIYAVVNHNGPQVEPVTETSEPVVPVTQPPVTDQDSVVTSPAVSSKWIAFNSSNAGNQDIYIIDTSGENLTRVTGSSAHEFYPSWSPDGNELVYQILNGTDMELAVININTKAVRYLTENECDDWGPAWSPHGDWIAFYSNCDGEKEAREIYKMRSDGSDRIQLTFTSGQYNWFPSWSPDGQKITFTSNRSGKYFIYTMQADGGNPQQMARGCVSDYSPDGSQILYGVYCNEADAIWLMNSDGSGQHEIITGHQCKNATWSPDGTQIVFQETQESATDGPFSLYIMDLSNPDDSNWHLLTGYDQNAISPAWQP